MDIQMESSCSHVVHHPLPPWRNWLARSAVNRKVGGSSPPGGAIYFFINELHKQKEYVQKKFVDSGRTRTCNPLIRSQMPYPLGHRASWREPMFSRPVFQSLHTEVASQPRARWSRGMILA